MEEQENKKEQKQKQFFTIFGEPIIKTRCQRDAFMTAIMAGIGGGLTTFLFTSNPRGSTHMGIGTYFIVGIGYACYCTYDEINTRKQRRLLKQMIHEHRQMSLLNDESTKLKDA